MSRNQARIFTSIWNDTDFTDRSSAAQRLYFLALSQPELNLCGVVPYTARRWSHLAPDTTVKTLTATVNELIEHRFVVVDCDTEELWIRRFLKWDGVLKSPNLIVAMSRDFLTIHSERIREGFLQGLAEGFPEGLPQPIADALPKGFLQGLANGSVNPSRNGSRARDVRALRAHGAEPLASCLLPLKPGLPPLHNLTSVVDNSAKRRTT